MGVAVSGETPQEDARLRALRDRPGRPVLRRKRRAIAAMILRDMPVLADFQCQETQLRGIVAPLLIAAIYSVHL